MAIDQLPFNVKIPTNEPESTGIDNLDTEVVEEEQVTWRDIPPPGALLMRKPTDREVTAMKNFGKGIINFQEQVSLDMIPGLGEVRMQGYTNEEIDLFKQAVEREDYPAAAVHGIGTPIMAAGMLPWWFGVPGKWAARAYRSATAPFRRKATTVLEQSNELIGATGVGYRRFHDTINTPRLRVAYEQWLAGLPEYRRVADTAMVQRNLEEFQLLTPQRINLFEIEGRANAAIARDMPHASPAQVQKEWQREIKEQKMKHHASVIDKRQMLESGSVPTRITEKFSSGESLAPIRTGTAATTSEFLGSQAYDVIAAQNFKQMPVKNMSEFLAGMVRSGKLKKEEMFDSGLLKLDANNNVVGGAFFELSANTPNMIISKQDILKILNESPAQNLKIKTYKSSKVSPGEYYDLYATTTMMGNTMANFLQKAIFSTKNTAARSKLIQVQKDINALDKSMYHTANDLKFDNSNFLNIHFLPMVERMNNVLPSLDSGAQQVLRAYMENAKKINNMANKFGISKKGHVEAFKASGGTHGGFEGAHSLPGGFNYQEKVIYLDEAIPFNTGKGRERYTSHFPVDNPIVHIRSKTRYDRAGNEIIAIEEIQSDLIQPFWDAGGKGKREAMTSPYGTALTEAHVRRRLNEINAKMEPLLPKNLKKEVTPGNWVERSITDSELKTLQKYDAEKAELRKFLVKQDVQIEGAANTAIRAPTGEKVNFFPYMRRTGGVPGYDMLAIKAMVDDAIRSGQRGVTIIPAGVGNRSKDAGMYLFYGDTKGTKLKGLEKKALPAGKGKKKISPDAIYIDALKKVAKQIQKEHGITLKVVQREIFNYDPLKLYAIENKSGQVVGSFKTRQNRDFVLTKKNEASPSGEGFTALNLAEGAPGSKDLNKAAFKSLVLEIPDSAAKTLSKQKMSTYREGGLVAIEPKREYFAAVI